jgi:NAD(P)-dependent dehydrogenase (short-subunit alcohol dehydrogenase family)
MQFLNNKLVVIVGGAGSLGKYLAEFFGAKGCRLLLVDKDKEKLKAISSKLNQYNVRYFPIDVTKPNLIEHLANDIISSGKQPDILINAIGLNIMTKYEESNNGDWKMLAESVLKGSRNSIKFLAGNAVDNVIINIMPFPESVSNTTATLYNSLKSGIVSLTTIWARELAKDNVRVNAIQPGFFAENLQADSEKEGQIILKIPAGKPGNYSDIAELILFLASPKGQLINGAIIPIDGGYFC